MHAAVLTVALLSGTIFGRQWWGWQPGPCAMCDDGHCPAYACHSDYGGAYMVRPYNYRLAFDYPWDWWLHDPRPRFPLYEHAAPPAEEVEPPPAESDRIAPPSGKRPPPPVREVRRAPKPRTAKPR